MVGTRIPKEQFMQILGETLKSKGHFAEYDPKTDTIMLSAPKLQFNGEAIFRSTSHAALIPRIADWMSDLSSETLNVLLQAAVRELPSVCNRDTITPAVYSREEVSRLSQFYVQFFMHHINNIHHLSPYLPKVAGAFSSELEMVVYEYSGKSRRFHLLNYQVELLSRSISAPELCSRALDNAICILEKDLDKDYLFKGFSRAIQGAYEINLEKASSRSLPLIMPRVFGQLKEMSGFTTEQLYLLMPEESTIILLPGDVPRERVAEYSRQLSEMYDGQFTRTTLKPFIATCECALPT